MQDLTPEQYFLNLACNDIQKYNELILFSKKFIEGTLESQFIMICGETSSGKTHFIKLLELCSGLNDKIMRRGSRVFIPDIGNKHLIYSLSSADYVWFHEGAYYTHDFCNKVRKTNQLNNTYFIIEAYTPNKVFDFHGNALETGLPVTIITIPARFARLEITNIDVFHR